MPNICSSIPSSIMQKFDEDRKERFRLVKELTDTRPELQYILKADDITEVAFAGEGYFDSEGKFITKMDGPVFKYLIRYNLFDFSILKLFN